MFLKVSHQVLNFKLTQLPLIFTQDNPLLAGTQQPSNPQTVSSTLLATYPALSVFIVAVVLDACTCCTKAASGAGRPYVYVMLQLQCWFVRPLPIPACNVMCQDIELMYEVSFYIVNISEQSERPGIKDLL